MTDILPGDPRDVVRDRVRHPDYRDPNRWNREIETVRGRVTDRLVTNRLGSPDEFDPREAPRPILWAVIIILVVATIIVGALT